MKARLPGGPFYFYSGFDGIEVHSSVAVLVGRRFSMLHLRSVVTDSRIAIVFLNRCRAI